MIASFAGVALAAAALIVPTQSGGGDVDSVIVKGKKHFDSPISLYQGRFYVEADNALRYCIRHRETRHAYGRVNSTGKYRGAYQADSPMKNGMGWMIQKELRATGTPKKQAKRIGKKLRASEINNWSIYYQDMAFWLVWDHGKGKSHWEQTNYGGGC